MEMSSALQDELRKHLTAGHADSNGWPPEQQRAQSLYDVVRFLYDHTKKHHSTNERMSVAAVSDAAMEHVDRMSPRL